MRVTFSALIICVLTLVALAIIVTNVNIFSRNKEGRGITPILHSLDVDGGANDADGQVIYHDDDVSNATVSIIIDSSDGVVTKATNNNNATKQKTVNANHHPWGITSWHTQINNQSHPHFYLQGTNEQAGMGHSFIAFNHLVTLARENDLIPRFHFTTNGHGSDPARVQAYFFDEGFMMALPYPAGMEESTTNCTVIKTSSSSLESDVSGIRKNQPSSSSAHCVVFIMADAIKPRERGADTNLPIFRELFNANDIKRQSIIKRKAKKTDDGSINIGVHIRRGDLFWWVTTKQGSALSQASLRLVATSAYVEVLRQLLLKLALLGEHKINVHLFCQGMTGNSTVQEVDGTFVDLAAVTILAAQDNYFMTAPEKNRYHSLFVKHVSNYGFVSKETVVELLKESGLDLVSAESILTMVDDPVDNKLNWAEFEIAMHLGACITEKGLVLPTQRMLPPSLARIRDDSTGQERQERASHQPNTILADGSELDISFHPGNPDDLQAFDDMCHSDIFITGSSSLSEAASILCDKPVILAMSTLMTQSLYSYIPNAMAIASRKGEFFLPNLQSVVNVTNSAKFNETQFELLWRNRKP